MPGSWPKLADVRSWLRMQPDDAEDQVIDAARVAAVDYGVRRLGTVQSVTDNGDGTFTVDYVPRWDVDAVDVPDACIRACVMDAARIYRRRDSTDGTIGWGDMGAVRVGRADPDVERLYSLYALLVFG